jgi:hypothetical protein
VPMHAVHCKGAAWERSDHHRPLSNSSPHVAGAFLIGGAASVDPAPMHFERGWAPAAARSVPLARAPWLLNPQP